MNEESPRNTPSGAAHHVSRREVFPKPRWTAVTGITCMKAASEKQNAYEKTVKRSATGAAGATGATGLLDCYCGGRIEYEIAETGAVTASDAVLDECSGQISG